MAQPGLAGILKFVEGELLTLSAEARRALPAVKEAAERSAFDCRANLRGGGSGDPFASLPIEQVDAIKSQWLQPFVFACNHVDAPRKIIVVALSAIQRMITSDAVAGADMASIARILELQVG